MGSTRDDKEQIGYDSALCRREATEDHRSRASEYEWSVGATLLRRNLQERDRVRRTTRNPSIPDFTGLAMFRVRSEGFSEAPEQRAKTCF